MPKKDLTEIIVVLDRSGSMQSICADMRGGFDMFIEEQRKLPGKCVVTLVQFDNEYDIVYAGKSLADVPKLELVPRGGTALLDAMGKTINATGARFAALPEENRPERVLFVVISDGHENASMEFTREAVLSMVSHQTDVYKWQFVYFGANQDAITAAKGMGIAVAANFAANAAGTSKAMADLNIGTRSYRSGGGYTSGN